jgi:hypothetical protein
MTAGGKRKGAGRKPREAPLVALTMKLDPDLLDAWNARKAELGISGPALLAKFLRWRRRGGEKRNDSKRRAKSNTQAER